jgi:hypothetical protein
MSLTNEQIKQIIDGAPDGATHIHDDCYYEYGMIVDTYRLSDLAEILALRERVAELELVRSEIGNYLFEMTGCLTDEVHNDLCDLLAKADAPKESTNERD